MTDSQEPAPDDQASARQKYLEMKQKTRQTLLGCLAGLGLCLACCLLPGTVTSVMTYLTTAPWQVSAPDVQTILLIDMGELLGMMLWYSLFAFVIAGGIIGLVVKKAKVLEVPAVIVFGIIGPGFLVYWLGCQEFVAVRTGQGTVELRYLWLRPARRLDASTLASVRAVETDRLRGGDDIAYLWLLEVEVDHVASTCRPTGAARSAAGRTRMPERTTRRGRNAAKRRSGLPMIG